MTEVSYDCVPPCKGCRDAGVCNPANTRASNNQHGNRDSVGMRARNFYGEVFQAPCGCFLLPWPILHTLGENFDEIICDKHGWIKIPKGKKKEMRKKAAKLAQLPEDPLW